MQTENKHGQILEEDKQERIEYPVKNYIKNNQKY